MSASVELKERAKRFSIGSKQMILTSTHTITKIQSPVFNFFDLLFINLSSYSYQMPRSPILREIQLASNRKNTQTMDWKKPIAVVNENLRPKIPFLYTKVDNTSATSITRLFCNANGRSKPLPKILPRFIINKITIVDLIPGNVMCHISFHLPAPSTRAASYISWSTPARAAKKTMVPYPVSLQISCPTISPQKALPLERMSMDCPVISSITS